MTSLTIEITDSSDEVLNQYLVKAFHERTTVDIELKIAGRNQPSRAYVASFEVDNASTAKSFVLALTGAA